MCSAAAIVAGGAPTARTMRAPDAAIRAALMNGLGPTGWTISCWNRRRAREGKYAVRHAYWCACRNRQRDLGTSATGLFMLATQSSLLTVASVLTSLYPATTMVLAAVVLREHITRWQGIGLGNAGIAVGLVAAG